VGATSASGARERRVTGTQIANFSEGGPCRTLVDNFRPLHARPVDGTTACAGQVAQGFKVIVQPSTRRIFPDVAYAEAGAVIQEDLTEASVVLAVKEVPIGVLIPNRTYCFFSHTKKAQVCACARVCRCSGRCVRAVPCLSDAWPAPCEA
jgi:hypothetical protein